MSDANGLLFSEESEENVSSLFENTTGVFSSQMIERLVQARSVFSLLDIEPEQIQPASLDLRLGRRAWKIKASFLPGSGVKVLDRVPQIAIQEIDLTEGFLLEKKAVYLVELQENLALSADVYGVANPKSSTGRLDVLTRLITDGSTEFDRVDPSYKGALYLEVAPLSFGIIARQGDRLNQLRFQRGKDRSLVQSRMNALYESNALVGTPRLLPLRNGELVPVTVDLHGSGPGSIVAYKAKKATNEIDLAKIGTYDPEAFWQAHFAGGGSLTLEENAFYILATKEDVGVPHALAAEMVPYDNRSGEFRVHYAGFFDPGFGMIDGKARGSKAVLEVRSHGVPFTLEHGQIVGWLRYAPVAYGRPTKQYGVSVRSNYQGQGLRLAKQFKPWPTVSPPSPDSLEGRAIETRPSQFF